MGHLVEQQLKEQLQEVQCLSKELDEIMVKAGELSEKCALMERKFQQFGGAVAAGTVMIASDTMQKKGFKSAVSVGAKGAAVASAAVAIGWGIKKVGDAWAEHKRKQELKKILPKKQALAQKKSPQLSRLIQDFREFSRKFGKVLDRDMPIIVQSSEWSSRGVSLQKGLESAFNGVFKTELAIVRAEYQLAEFQAWQNGKHESSAMFEPAKAREETFRKLTRKCLRGECETPFELPEKLNQGTIFVLSSELTSEHVSADPAFKNLADQLAAGRVSTIFWPFGTKRKHFREYHQVFFADSKQVGGKVVSTVTGRIVVIFILIFVVSLISASIA